MKLKDEDMRALSLIDVDSLPITKPQKIALGKLVQSIRGFVGRMQEEGAVPEGKPFMPRVVEANGEEK